jgi:GMP synthase (glutamine-hydrolysing)
VPLRFLVVASETRSQREERRLYTNEASDESYAATLTDLAPGCVCEHVSCVDRDDVPSEGEIQSYDGLFFAGSPIQMHDDSEEARRAARFMRAVFAAGVPAFGSCAGLQIAVVAAGGSVKPRSPRMEAGFARGIVATAAGRKHPLLAGRPLTWDAPAMHSDEVDRLPEGAVLLASTQTTQVQAVEIRSGAGLFWGVQYHPELTLGEIAASFRRQGNDLIEEGLCADKNDVERFAGRVAALGVEPHRRDLAWQLGLDAEMTDPVRRTRELGNFIERVVRPRARERGTAKAA